MTFEMWMESAGLSSIALSDSARGMCQMMFDANADPGVMKELLGMAGSKETQAPPVTSVELDNFQKEKDRLESIRMAAVNYELKLAKVNIRHGDRVFSGIEEFKAAAVDDVSIDKNAFLLACMKAELSMNKPPAVHVTKFTNSSEAATIALARMCNVPNKAVDASTGESFGLENSYSEQALEEADRNPRFRYMSLHSLFNLAIEAATGSPWHGDTHNWEFLRLAQQSMRMLESERFHSRANPNSVEFGGSTSTISVEKIFEDVGNKILESRVRTQPTTWQYFAKCVNVKDFRPTKLYQYNTLGLLTPLGNDGRFERGEQSEGYTSLNISTYGRLEGVNRNDLINDDMGVFVRMFEDLGDLAPRTHEELFYHTFLANLNTIFTSGRGNLLEAGSGLDYDGLTAATTLVKNRVTVDGMPLLSSPKYLLVGGGLEVAAARLMGDESVHQTVNSKSILTTNNPFRGKFSVVSSPYLDNTLLKQHIFEADRGKGFPNQSATQWFLMPSSTDPEGTPIAMSFLHGNRVPYVETADSDFDHLGMQWRIYTDVGCDVYKPETAVRCTGATA
ncbi:MAG: hypothetical protein Q4D38_07905 [Planctomycetia bacterium]|nr:hypothetical protein [Planctomycetia bacterium]